MSYFRFIFSFGLIFICFLSEAHQSRSLDSLRILAYEISQDSTIKDKRDLAVIKQFLAQAKLLRSNEDIIFAYQQLAAINYQLGDTNQALHYYKLYVVELEQLSDNEKFKRQNFEKNLFENEIKALNVKIESLAEEKNLVILAYDDLLAQNYWIYLGLRIVLVIGIILLGGWLYYKYKTPKKKSVEVKIPANTESVADVLSATKEDLTRAQTELNLADLLVQEIITHPDDSFSGNKSIRKKFLIHQPKNMAGGDGLFLAVEKYKTLIAVFDTPGYGAAGGLLSTRIYKLLEALVTEHKILLPDLILNQLEINLLNLFPAGVPFTGGIGMAICLYNSTEKTMTFSGANMDLFMVQKGVLQKHHGATKRLIDNGDAIEYTNTVVNLGRGTNLYLSTEGYWLQQGGHDHKPLGKAAFEKTIESLSSQPISDHQQVLNKIFNDWKGGYEQDDDVLVLGLGF